MIGKIRNLVVVGTLVAWPLTANAQDPSQGLPRAPVPIVQGAPPLDKAPDLLPPPALSQNPSPSQLPPPPPAAPGQTFAPLPPPPPAIYPYPDTNGPLLRNDPVLDGPQGPPPGWLFNLDFDLLGTHIKNRLQAPVVTDSAGTTYLVHLPTAQLDWTLSPRFEFGYRFPEGLGELLVSYRFLSTEGRATLAGFDLDGSDVPLHSNLDINVVDIDYASREYSLPRHWITQWRAGARIATVYFNSEAPGYFIEERTSNNFVGGGPHVGLDFWRGFDSSQFSLFGRIDAATVIGSVHQNFEEAYVTQDGSFTGGATSVSHTQAVPMLSLQAGLSWSSHWRGHWTRYAFGYMFEQWWNVGEASGSNADLTSQGVFFRAEYSF